MTTGGDNTQPSPRATVRGTRRVRLAVVEGPDAGTTLEPESASATVGTAADNSLVLRDRTVSRYHLELRWGPDGIRVEDLGSLNGTLLGATRIERAVVPAGARLQMGDTLLEIADGALLEEAEHAAPAELPGMIGESEALRSIAREVSKLAPSGVSVLLHGETGTGKELLARAIHATSPRAHEPFEVVDCGSMPATLIAAELFGHERGAFTGADRERKGSFERAHGGTLFLDEVGELPVELQPVLLGAIERGRFRRVGGWREIEVDVRIVSATHRDLRSAVNDGSFRADLYYRIAGARVVVPPLRERPEDIPLLVNHFVREITGDANRTPFGFATMELLAAHHWSGNIRELRNVVEAALTIGRLHLDGQDQGDEAAGGLDAEPDIVPYRDARATALSRFEMAYLEDLITRARGNASEAARRARMDRPYLLTLLRKHGLR